MDNKDPLYEDEVTLIPTGLQFGEVIDLDIDTSFKSRKGNYGWTGLLPHSIQDHPGKYLSILSLR